MGDQQDSICKMTPNVSKIVEAIVYVVSEARKRVVPVSQYEIVKTLFLADQIHLNKYGRPITFDNYVAMRHGPVPSLAYDLLKENGRSLQRAGIKKLPWKRGETNKRGIYNYTVTRDANEDILSPSDMEEMRDALTMVKKLGFSQIRKLTHENPAYVQAWKDDDPRNQFPMDYALLFEVRNDAKAKELAFLSKHI
jgi:uncharacterized phage-associated protein